MMTGNPYFSWIIFMAVYLVWMNFGLLFVSLRMWKRNRGIAVSTLCILMMLDIGNAYVIATVLG